MKFAEACLIQLNARLSKVEHYFDYMQLNRDASGGRGVEVSQNRGILLECEKGWLKMEKSEKVNNSANKHREG